MSTWSIFFLFFFLDEFSEFLSSLALTKDWITGYRLLGDLKIHIVIKSDSLNSQFKSILDELGFLQVKNAPTHKHNHTFDLILTYGLSLQQIDIFFPNPVSDHFFTFSFILADYNLPKLICQI